MKTMDKIINSIKDKNFRKYAIGLQEKPELVNNTIINNKKKCKEVTGAKKSALQTSTANYAEKKRGNIPQKVAALLAATMLATMLASCDEMTGPTLPSEDTTGIEDAATPDSGSETPEDSESNETIQLPTGGEEGIDFNVQNFKTLEVEEFNSVPVDPNSCGDIGILSSYFDFSKMIGQSSVSEILYKDYIEKYTAYPGAYEDIVGGTFDCFQTFAIFDVASSNKKRNNVALEFKEDRSGWKHKLVSTDYNFALVSQDENGNIFLTGFVNGRFENDLGFIDSGATESLKEASKKYSYNEIINATRQEIFSSLYEKVRKCDETCFIGYHTTFQDDEGNIIHPSLWECLLTDFQCGNFATGSVLSGRFNYDVPDNYFDKILESGKVIDGTIMMDNESGNYYVPGYVQSGENDDHADNDPNAGNNNQDEETNEG